MPLILQASNVAHLSHATLLPAAQVTVPHFPLAKLAAEKAVLAAAVITSPQLTAWFGVSQGVLADVPLLESLPPPAAVARKYEDAHAGDASKENKTATAILLILKPQAPKTVEKI
jgi:hypothetical protein